MINSLKSNLVSEAVEPVQKTESFIHELNQSICFVPKATVFFDLWFGYFCIGLQNFHFNINTNILEGYK